jgi:hypothetical protein
MSLEINNVTNNHSVETTNPSILDGIARTNITAQSEEDTLGFSEISTTDLSNLDEAEEQSAAANSLPDLIIATAPTNIVYKSDLNASQKITAPEKTNTENTDNQTSMK